MQEKILWTALPNGLSNGGASLLLSILVSPRLDTGGPAELPLGDFPGFSIWPKHPLEIALRFGSQPPVIATIASPAPDPELWAALFPLAETTVRSFQPADFSQRRINSFPAENVAGFVRRTYAAIGVASPADLPGLDLLADHGITDVRTVEGEGREWWRLDDQREEQLDLLFSQSNLPALHPAPPDPPMDFFRVVHFHRFRGGKIEDPVVLPEPDFHEAVALLGDHPFLLRRLGLIVDVEVPLSGQPASSTVRVETVTHDDFTSVDQPIAVNYELDAGADRFLAAPGQDSAIEHGMLRLANGSFGLQQVDVDGAALKVVQLANRVHMRRQGRKPSLDSSNDDGLPALRTGGISVVRTGRSVAMSQAFAEVAKADGTMNPNTPPELFVDDVMRGFRVDVLDDGTWRSLCRRTATYKVGRLGGEAAELEADDEEGVVTAAAGSDVNPSNDDLFLHEALFHWDGWSLVAPRPGEVIGTDGLTHSEELDAEGRHNNPSHTSLELEVSSRPTGGSLPRLRFGRSYRLRARAVDVAGNSLPLSSPDDSQATEPLTYRRFEPLEPPAVVIVSGQPLEGLPGESATRLVIRTYNPTPADDAAVSPEICERLLLPPRTVVTMIEQAGLLDDPTGVDGSAATWNLLAARDAATMPELIDDPAQIPAEVPYLADPFVEGAVLRGLPGTAPGAAHPTSFDTGADWWQGKPFRLAIIEGQGAPQWDAASRVLTVEVAKASVVTVRLSSRFRPEDLDRLAVWKWIEEEAFDDEDRDRLKQLALEGCHWMLTPYRELTLVHAVQQPLAAPEILSLDPRKARLGDTFAQLEGDVEVHAASTGKLELMARWTEPTGYGFARKPGESHAFDITVADPGNDVVALGGRRHEFGDTRHRRVTYFARATTRFRDYFDPSLPAEELTRPPAEQLPPLGDQHVFEVDVLSSARPLAPSPLYVIPTFGWEAGHDTRGAFSRRSGGLRIYLEEPWFSSGDGELLGVVVWPGQADACAGSQPTKDVPYLAFVPDRMKPYATQWGRDPIWLSGPAQQVPSLANFTRAVARELGLELQERPGAFVGVAGHEVGYDDDRQLFYCDLDVDLGDSYFPFVRLALARYQPKSIAGAELSRVVVADFIQPAPDRIVWAAREPDDPGRIRVTVSGTGYRANASFFCTSEIEARLERHLDASEGDIGWVPVSRAPTLLTNVQALHTLGVWEGEFDLPPDRPDARFRVVVEEYEAFKGDVPGAELPEGEFGSGRERRLVYSDVVEIDLAADVS